MTRTMVRGGPGVRAAAAISLALVVAGVTACGSTPEAPPTDRVQRGTVSTQVSASGALASVTSQNLGFQKGAQLKELRVKVGDTVQPGQILAILDDFNFRVALQQAQATLAQAQANLDRLIAGVAVPNAERSLDQTEDVIEKTKKLADKQIDQAEFSANQAKKAYKKALANYYKAKKVCDPDQPPVPDPTMDASDGIDPNAPASPAATGGSATDANGGASPGTGLLNGLSSLGAPCTQSQYDAIQSAKTAAKNAKTSWIQAENNKDIVVAQQKLAIENAETSRVTALNTLDAAEADRPGTIDAQAALVSSAQATVRSAQRDVDNTILRAPVAGSVSAITGQVGEFIGGGSPTTALAPGTNASIPGVGAAASSDAAGQAASGLSATRPGGGAFIVLNNVNTYQVVVPFEESDAAKVQPNQQVDVTFDAIPDLQRKGTVLSIAPSGTNISGVTNYYATILLTESDPRLRAGLTAEAGVLTSQADNVLMVPNSAVIRQGGKSYVNVPGPDGQPMRKEFVPGMVGDTHTEVKSGLVEGEQLMIPQPTPAPGSGSTSGGGGGTGGGGGGG